MATTTRPHEFNTSVSENDSLECLYYKKIIAPLLRQDGLVPVDLRHDTRYQKADIDFGGKLDNDIVKTIEVKFDHAAAVTGNIFLETVSVDKGANYAKTPGCFLISEAEEFHQIVILRNQIYISDLKAMREYWYSDEEDVPRIMHPEYTRFIRRNVKVYNQNYESIGDCVNIELLFGENHRHSEHYLRDIYAFDDSMLAKMVPISERIVEKQHSVRHKEVLNSYPEEVSRWLR